MRGRFAEVLTDGFQNLGFLQRGDKRYEIPDAMRGGEDLNAYAPFSSVYMCVKSDDGVVAFCCPRCCGRSEA